MELVAYATFILGAYTGAWTMQACKKLCDEKPIAKKEQTDWPQPIGLLKKHI